MSNWEKMRVLHRDAKSVAASKLFRPIPPIFAGKGRNCPARSPTRALPSSGGSRRSS